MTIQKKEKKEETIVWTYNKRNMNKGWYEHIKDETKKANAKKS